MRTFYETSLLFNMNIGVHPKYQNKEYPEFNISLKHIGWDEYLPEFQFPSKNMTLRLYSNYFLYCKLAKECNLDLINDFSPSLKNDPIFVKARDNFLNQRHKLFFNDPETLTNNFDKYLVPVDGDETRLAIYRWTKVLIYDYFVMLNNMYPSKSFS